MIQTSYLLSMALFLTGFFYFVFNEWYVTSPFFRMSVVTAAFLLVIIVYFLINRFYNGQLFSIKWLYVVIGVFYGLAIMLNGMAYNLHAPTYLFFFIWLVPVLLLSFVTHYFPLTVLSYILLHALFVTVNFLPDELWNIYLIHLMFLVMNALVFMIALWRENDIMKHISYLVFWGAFLSLVMWTDLPFNLMNHVVFIGLIIVAFYGWLKHSKQVMLLVVTSLAMILFVLMKVMDYVWTNYGEFAFFVVLGIAILVMLFSSLFVGLLRRGKVHELSVRVISVTAAVIATLLATVAITGLFFIFFPESSETVLYFFALLILLPFGLFSPFSAQIRYTLVGTGYLLAVFMSQMHTGYQLLLVGLLLVGYFIAQIRGMKFVLTVLTHVVLLFMLSDLWDVKVALYIVAILALVTYFLVRGGSQLLGYLNFSLVYVYLISLTYAWYNEGSMEWIVHGIVFLALTISLLLFTRQGLVGEARVSYAAWFVFVVLKYIQFGWDVLDFSWVALLAGAVMLVISNWMERKHAGQELASGEPENSGGVWSLTERSVNIFAVGIVFVLMVGIVSYQWITSEMSLRDGTDVTLAVEDSYIYGDGQYQLQFEIEDLTEAKLDYKYGEHITFVLHPDDGVYLHSGAYFDEDGVWNQPHQPAPDEVLLTGKMQYDTADFGFGKYYDKSGRKNLDITVAKVRVSSRGDGVLLGVE